VVEQLIGRGRVLHIGGAHVFTNRFLAEGDNAVLVTDLLAGVADAQLVRPAPPGSGDRTLLELLPGGFWRLLVQLGVAVLLFVWASAVRLGRPVREPALLQLDGTALTDAVSQLYQRTGRTALAATWLRRRTRRLLARQYQLTSAAPAELAATASRAAGRPTDTGRYAAALGEGPVADGAALVELAATLDRLREEVGHGA
jgi:hypothetical protein